MELNIEREEAILKRLSTKQLRERFQEVFDEPTKAGNRTWLIRRILWRLQALAQGDLSERARQRAERHWTHGNLFFVKSKWSASDVTVEEMKESR